jgi:tRNA(Ile)-lysidine synthase
VREGLAPPVAAVRVAVRRLLAEVRPAGVLVACSGGADSVALAAATAFEAPRLAIPAGLVTVDHALQEDSAGWAGETAELGRALGLDPVLIRRVDVGTAGGPEAAARAARYRALADAAADSGAGWAVLLAHTLDDQAETVLLGLGRGSGPRSIAGMRPVDGRWLRPLLGVRRGTTRAACAAERLAYRDDPHNADPRFTRVRLRTEVLPLLEDVLQGGVAAALARTAQLLRDDLDALDDLAAALTPATPATATPATATPATATPATATLAAGELARHPRAIRTRVLRNWVGVPLSAVQVRALDALVADWHGQGPVALPSGLEVRRTSGMLHLSGADR